MLLDNLMLGLSTTLVGVLVVFLGLVILIACIYVMGMMSKKGSGKKKSADPKPAPAPMAAPAPVPPIQPEVNVQDDTQLIAVITAAIAAVWQNEQSGFVVRRVRRVDSMNARARAAREEQIYSHF